jgi:hypothetical protein
VAPSTPRDARQSQATAPALAIALGSAARRCVHELGENHRMSVYEVIDRLYSLPPEEFTQARKEAERELRKAGEREQADLVKALRKPTAAAGAVNRLVRSHRAEVEAFFEAAARLRDAQVAGKGDLAAAARDERVALDELVALGGQSVRTALEAAAVDDDIAGEVLGARLVTEPEPAGFGTLLAHADPDAAKAASAKRATSQAMQRKQRAKSSPAEPGRRRPPTAAKPDDSLARVRLKEARETLTAAEAEERQARRRWEQTQRELKKAQTAVEKAQRELDRLPRG